MPKSRLYRIWNDGITYGDIGDGCLDPNDAVHCNSAEHLLYAKFLQDFADGKFTVPGYVVTVLNITHMRRPDVNQPYATESQLEDDDDAKRGAVDASPSATVALYKEHSSAT